MKYTIYFSLSRFRRMFLHLSLALFLLSGTAFAANVTYSTKYEMYMENQAAIHRAQIEAQNGEVVHPGFDYDGYRNYLSKANPETFSEDTMSLLKKSESRIATSPDDGDDQPMAMFATHASYDSGQSELDASSPEAFTVRCSDPDPSLFPTKSDTGDGTKLEGDEHPQTLITDGPGSILTQSQEDPEELPANRLNAAMWLTDASGNITKRLQADQTYIVHIRVETLGDTDAEGVKIHITNPINQKTVLTGEALPSGAMIIAIGSAENVTGCVSEAIIWAADESLLLDYVRDSAQLIPSNGGLPMALDDAELFNYELGCYIGSQGTDGLIPVGRKYACEITFQVETARVSPTKDPSVKENDAGNQPVAPDNYDEGASDPRVNTDQDISNKTLLKAMDDLKQQFAKDTMSVMVFCGAILVVQLLMSAVIIRTIQKSKDDPKMASETNLFIAPGTS